MSLPDESAEKVILTADTAVERPHLPSPETLRGSLPLADGRYFDRGYPGAVDRAGPATSRAWCDRFPVRLSMRIPIPCPLEQP